MNLIDIIGPVMIGPSSSHTAGAVRLGLLAASILGGKPVKAEINLHGSFAETYQGHGTDMALLAGQFFGPDAKKRINVKATRKRLACFVKTPAPRREQSW